MSITDEERHQIFNWYEEAMGSERAAMMMMHLLPPVGWGDVATKQDLQRVERGLKGDLHELEQRMDLRFEALEHKITSALRQEIVASTRTFVTWMIAVGGVVVTSVGVATGLVIGLA